MAFISGVVLALTGVQDSRVGERSSLWIGARIASTVRETVMLVTHMVRIVYIQPR